MTEDKSRADDATKNLGLPKLPGVTLNSGKGLQVFMLLERVVLSRVTASTSGPTYRSHFELMDKL